MAEQDYYIIENSGQPMMNGVMVFVLRNESALESLPEEAAPGSIAVLQDASKGWMKSLSGTWGLIGAGVDSGGMPMGGSAGQVLMKQSSATYDADWENPNMVTPESIAIVSNGDTHAAIVSGQYVYVRGHSTLAEGLYVAKSAIDVNGALSTSNLTAIGNGGLNALKSKYDTIYTAAITWDSNYTPTRSDLAIVYKKGNMCQLLFWNVSWANEITTDTVVGTIPAGFKPPEKTSFFGYNRRQELCRGWIGPDGGLRISLYPGELMYISCTYIVGT